MKTIHLRGFGTCVECNTKQRMDINGIIEKHPFSVETPQDDCKGSGRPSSTLPKPVELSVVK